MLPATGNILVVDDQRDDLRLLAALLTGRGHVVRPALDGASALVAARSEPPDLILLDIQMTQLDGYETCRRLKVDARTRDIPVIFISARNDVIDKIKAFAVGGVDYISKPFQAEEVVARIETQLRLGAMQQRLEAQNRMLQQEIAERMRIDAELQRHQNHLEELVEARTAELTTTNIHLQLEIAERMRLDEALYLTRFTVDRVADALYWMDVNGRFVDVNDAACRMLGYTREELLTMSVFDINPGASLEGWRQIWQDLKLVGTSTREATHQAKDGRLIPVELVANFIEFGDRQLNCALVRDISERKRVEEARRAQEQAEAANKAKSAFLAHISHELRTPLNGILGYTRILKQQVLDKDTLHGLNVIQYSGEHLLTLINDILDLAKIEAGKVDLMPSDVPLPDFLDKIVGILRSRVESKHLQLSYTIAPSLPRVVQVDEKCLRQILLNLLGNAIKFTNLGQISLILEECEEAPTERDAQKPFDCVRVRFTVSDTGIGIAADQLERIFEPFVQSGAADRRIEGTGLGLAISRHLIEMLGGKLQVQSRLGQGSSFWFELTLPRSADDPAQIVTHGQKLVGYQGPRRKVLVVDDQEDNRLILQEILEPLGFIVRAVSSGLQAVDQALAWQPDAILMDIMMPGKSGIDATRDLRAHDWEKPVIAISASVLESEIIRTLEAGCDAFVPKPIDANALLTILGDQLKLVWIAVAAPREQLEGSCWSGSGTLLLPPRADLEVMYRQAEQGNLIAIYVQVRRLAERDPLYQPFATELGDLSLSYEDDEVRVLLQEYIRLSS